MEPEQPHPLPEGRSSWPQEKDATLRLHLVFNSGDPCFKSPSPDIFAITGAEREWERVSLWSLGPFDCSTGPRPQSATA